MKRILFFLLALLPAMGLYAYDFKYGDLYYRITSDSTIEVTYPNGGSEKNYQGLTSISIPEVVTYNSITYNVINISGNAFKGCASLTSITIPNSIMSIGNWAFMGCTGLSYVAIGNSVTNIGIGAFCGCTSLTSITIPNSVTNIKEDAFKSCTGLTSITIPNSVTSIGGEAFENTPWYNNHPDGIVYINKVLYAYKGSMHKHTSITIEDGTISISPQAFSHCDFLTSVTIPNSVTTIGDMAFCFCTRLTSIAIPNSVTTIDFLAFANCNSLTSISIPNSVTSIGMKAFRDTPWYNNQPNGLIYINKVLYAYKGSMPDNTSIVIKNGTISITPNIFQDYTSLTSITIPNSVTSIGSYAFENCTGLTSITIESVAPPTIFETFGGVSKSIPIYVPCGSKKAYSNAEGWKYFTNIIEPPVANTISVHTSDTAEGKAIAVQPNTCQSDSAIIEATANDGYHFVNWSDGNTDNPRTIVITHDVTFIAYFADNNCDITLQTEFPDRGSIVGVGNGNYLSEISIEAVPNYGYHFVSWNDGVTNNPRSFILTQDTIFTAIFEPNRYSLSVSADNGGYIDGNNYITADYLSHITISTTPHYGYHFVQWSDGITDNPREIELIQDTVLIAHFVPNKYTIEATSHDDNRGTTYGDTVADYLDNVTITAVPNYGYHFTYWNDRNNTNPRLVEVRKDVSYIAYFDKNSYHITKHCNNTHGTIQGVDKAEYLDEITLSVQTDFGYSFYAWSDGNTDNPRIITLTQDTTFAAQIVVTTSGKCGDNLTWQYSQGSLCIMGSGDMYDYSQSKIPWLLLRDSISSIQFASGITSISDYAFYGCADITSLVIPNSVTSIGNYAFSDCPFLSSVTIGNNVTTIKDYTFSNCRELISVIIPNSVTTIGNGAFSGCKNMETISFGAGLTDMGDYALSGCQSIYEMTCYAIKVPTVSSNTFREVSSRAKLSVPFVSIQKYKTHTYWGVFNVISIDADSTTSDGNVTLQPCDNEVTITWPVNDNAGAYSILITKNGEEVCTLVFNSNGQLTGIAFAAPSRNGATLHAPAAMLTQSGYRFTVTGLSSGTQYAYAIDVKDKAGSSLNTYKGTFTTTANGTPTNVEDVTTDTSLENDAPRKVFRDGQVYILRSGKTFTLTGVEIK